MIIVHNDVDCASEIEGDNEQPKEWTYPHSEERQYGQQSGREVAVGGECGEGRWQIADDAWKDEDESEEAKAVQGSDGALGFSTDPST